MHYRLIEKQIMFKGKKVQVEVHRLENEETGKELRREICIHPGAVVILPFLGDKVLLIRNHRYSVRQVLIELPAGTLEKGEDPMNSQVGNYWRRPVTSPAGSNPWEPSSPRPEF